MSEVEKLADIINDFFGCDASYFGVNPFDLATHILENNDIFQTHNVVSEQLKKNLSRINYEYDKKILSIFADGIKDIIKIRALFGGKVITVATVNKIIDGTLSNINREIDSNIQRLEKV